MALSQIGLKLRLVITASLVAFLLGSGLLAGTGIARGAPAAGPTSANTLSIGWSIETKTLDPAGNSQNPDIWVQVNIYDKLVTVAPNGNTILPDLATTWKASNGGKVYTFLLRKGIKFQDGTPITAKDVAFCINRARKPAASWSWTLTAVKSVTALNSNTVRFVLSTPGGRSSPMSRSSIRACTPRRTSTRSAPAAWPPIPIGSGPYKFVTWKKGQYILLQKDPNYWNAAKYPMQYVKYELIPNDNTRLLQTEAGQLDVDNVLPFNRYRLGAEWRARPRYRSTPRPRRSTSSRSTRCRSSKTCMCARRSTTPSTGQRW